jgi:hypothetical protein
MGKFARSALGNSPRGLQFGNKCHVPGNGECEIVGKPTIQLDVGRVRVWTVKVFY